MLEPTVLTALFILYRRYLYRFIYKTISPSYWFHSTSTVLIMLGIDLVLISAIFLVLKDLATTKLLFTIYITYLAVTYSISDSYLVGSLSSTISLLTNPAVNYAILFISLVWWSNADYFFNKLNVVLLMFTAFIFTSILSNVNSNYNNLVILKKFINLELYNGILSIHPVVLLASIASVGFILIFTIIFLLCRIPYLQLYYKTSAELNTELDFLILKYSKTSCKLRKVTTLTLYINLISIILGAYWAHQELSWGGYWSWDPIEVFSLVALSVALILSHSVSNLPRYLILLLSLLLIFLIISFVRLNVVSSIHGFLDVNDLRFSITNFIIILLCVLSLVLYWTLKSVLIFFKNKLSSPRPAFRFYKSIVLYVNTLFFLFSFLYLTSVLLSNSVRPLSHNWFLSLALLSSTCLFIKNTSFFFTALPILDAYVLSSFFIRKRLTFSTRLVHFMIFIIVLFLLHYSHIFFIRLVINFTRESINLILTNITVISSSCFLTLNEVWLVDHHLPGSTQNRSVYVIPSNIMFVNLIANLTEVFSTTLSKGGDSILFGSNLFAKSTSTYPIFILSLIWFFTYKFIGRNKKHHCF